MIGRRTGGAGLQFRNAAGIAHGDILLEVDGLEVTGTTMGAAVDALRGAPGEMRILLLGRNGDRMTVQATVQRLLWGRGRTDWGRR